MISYNIFITTNASPDEVCRKIADIPSWWTKDFEGCSAIPGDEFIIHHPGAHYAKHKVTEIIPGRKLVWLVTESRLNWLQNQEEWTGTRMIFELTPDKLNFTHEGLTPDKESYERCSQGWNLVIKQQLFNFINTI